MFPRLMTVDEDTIFQFQNACNGFEIFSNIFDRHSGFLSNLLWIACLQPFLYRCTLSNRHFSMPGVPFPPPPLPPDGPPRPVRRSARTPQRHPLRGRHLSHGHPRPEGIPRFLSFVLFFVKSPAKKNTSGSFMPLF